MPITLTITQGLLPAGAEKKVFTKLCEAMLKWHGLTGNKTLTPNITGHVNVVPKGLSFAGLVEADVAFVEWKVPSFVFTKREVQEGYIEEATNIIYDAAEGRLEKSKIWINVLHAVDGAWGIGGVALTNQQLIGAVSQG